MTSAEQAPAWVEQMLDQLAAAGFSVVQERGSGTVNRQIELRRADFAVRVTADRGQWWVEGGLPDGSAWYDAWVWQTCLLGAPAAGQGASEEATYFVAHHGELAAAASFRGSGSSWRSAGSAVPASGWGCRPHRDLGSCGSEDDEPREAKTHVAMTHPSRTSGPARATPRTDRTDRSIPPSRCKEVTGAASRGA